MKIYYASTKSVQVLLSAIVLLLAISCNHDRQPTENTIITNRLLPPKVTVLANLPDSRKPQVTLLSDRPKPNIFIIPQPRSSHSFIDKNTHLPIPKEIQGTCFFTNYTTPNGLASDQLSCSILDRNGALWFGSHGAGVSKYDGKTFTNYGVAQGLPNNTIRCILEDRAGNLWFGTGGTGVSKYDGKTFTTYTTTQGLVHDYVCSILEDRKGNLWFTTLGGGVSKFNGIRFKNYTTAEGLAHNVIWSVVEDNVGNLWFSTDGSGLSKYDGKKFTTYTTAQGLANNDVFTSLKDKKGNLWFGTMGGGISKFDGNRFTTYTTKDGLAENALLSCFEDSKGNLWFGTNGTGISKFDGKTFVNFTTDQGLANNEIWGIVEDRLGNIWITTGGGGVSKYSGKSFTQFTQKQGIANTIIVKILEDKQGNLWFCNIAGVAKYNRKQLVNYTITPGIINNSINGGMVDKAGSIWFATDGEGVSKFAGNQFVTYTTGQGLISNYVYSVLEDKLGNIWFGTLDAGVSKFDGKRFTSYTTKQGLSNNSVIDMLEDNSGSIWFATNNGGVTKYDGSQFEVYTMAQGLGGNNVYSIVEDKAGNILIGTDQGLSVIRFDKTSNGKLNRAGVKPLNFPRFQIYTTKDGLSNNKINHIVEDNDGKLILGTNAGITVLNEGIHSFGKPSAIDIYNNATGYPVSSAWTLVADREGIVWIATESEKTGVVRFDPAAVKRNQKTPIIVLQTVKINNEAIAWHDLLPPITTLKNQTVCDSLTTFANVTEEVTTFGRELTQDQRDSLRLKFGDIRFDSVTSWYPIPQNLVLPYQHNNVTFEFNAIETSRNFLVKYQYRLEGYDEDWSPLTNKSSASFGNMVEGNYQFRVRALSPEGVWSKQITYCFRVLPPWWRSWWACVLYGFLLLGSIWGIVTLRYRQLTQANRLLEDTVAVRTTEVIQQREQIELINQKLSHNNEEIANQRDQVSQTLEELRATQTQLVQKEKMASLGELTAGIAHEIQNPLNFVNNFSKLSTRQLRELEEEQQRTDRDPELETELITDLKENLDKILHHGQRASVIVKGMLEHARTSTGEMRSTSLNTLVEEYVRLAYHGMRSTDNQFNCELVTQLDDSIGEIKLMPQEIGRVLFNLLNNAFYAISEQAARCREQSIAYQPKVSVCTEWIGHQPSIVVEDNGLGMSAEIMEKVFQPFFTTKPTGQGTGLGLSLSYDIVTKGHGGTLTVVSVENGGSTFSVKLPIT